MSRQEKNIKGFTPFPENWAVGVAAAEAKRLLYGTHVTETIPKERLDSFLSRRFDPEVGRFDDPKSPTIKELLSQKLTITPPQENRRNICDRTR